MAQKILIADDEKNIRLTLDRCLEGAGYETDMALNGEEALFKLGGGGYDLVLLDIKMPGLTGTEVLKEMRRRSDRTDVIMMTAYGTVENAVEAMKLGAVDFVSKPFTPDDIRRIVADVLSRKNLEEGSIDGFDEFIRYAKGRISDGDYENAEEVLKKAAAMEIEKAEPHNLLGVIAECRGDVLKAQKHYRAALALEPAYRPAQINLERSVQYGYTKDGMDLGEEDDG